MDRTQPFEYVFQLPRRNRPEIDTRDVVEDKQSLLNETWYSYALRQGYPSDRVHEEHVKWATETWAEFEARVIVRAQNLDDYFAAAHAQELARQREVDERAAQSSKLVESLMRRENAIRDAKIASIHTLFVDFEARQLEKMRAERAAIEDEETAVREDTHREEQEQRRAMEIAFAEQFQAVVDLLEARRLQREEDERRALEEQRRKAEELRQLEEQRKRDAEAADKARRDAEEEAKRQERKRREEERKNKAKAEREARSKQRTEQDATDETKPQTPRTDAPAAAAPVAVEAVVEPAIPAPPPAPSVAIPAFGAVAGDTVAQLMASVTSSLHVASWEAYTVMVQSDQESFLAAHNGFAVGVGAGTTSLGKTYSPSIVSPKLSKPGLADDLDAYIRDFVEVVPNASADALVTALIAQLEGGVSEGMIVLPVTPVAGTVDFWGEDSGAKTLVVVSAVADSATLLHPDVVRAIAQHVASQFTPKLLRLLSEHRARLLGHQALEWLSITTATKNCTFALANNPKAPTSLTFIAATAQQKFLIGKTFTKAEETTENVGVSFALIDESVKTGQPEVAHVSNVQDKTTNKVNGNELRFFGDRRAGSLLLCPVTRPTHPGQGEVFGVLYVDTMNDEKAFNKADEDIVRTTAVLLAELLSGQRNEATHRVDSVRLSIENDLFPNNVNDSPIQFLKHIWLKVNTDISQISANQLQELASYAHPPPIIPTTVSATLLVALGTNPKNLEAWEDMRKRVKTSLVEKIVNFDPSDPARRKKAFYTRARKVTKGLSAHDVFTRGSYPASCFFTWTFVTILIRKTADELRLLYKDSATANIPLALVASASAGAASTAAEDEDDGVSDATVNDDAKDDDADQ